MPPWEKYQGKPWEKYQKTAGETQQPVAPRKAPMDIRALSPGLMSLMRPEQLAQGQQTVPTAGQPEHDRPGYMKEVVGPMLPIAGAMAAPYAAPGLGLVGRALMTGAGYATGRQAEDVIEGGPSEGIGQNAKQIAVDTAIGAGTELGASAIGWAVGTLGRIGRSVGKSLSRRTGTDIVGDVVQGEAGRQATKMYDKLKALVPKDLPMPAPQTLSVINRLKEGGWNNPATRELRAAGKKANLLLSKLQTANTADDAFRVGYPDTASLAVPGALKASPRPGWTAHYFVFDNGKGVLAFRDGATGVWVDGTKAIDKATAKSLTEEGMGRLLAKQSRGSSLITMVDAPPLPDGTFAHYLQGFQVQRQPSMTFETLNDLMANSATFDEGFSNMGPAGKELYEELRDAIRADIKAHGPEAAAAVESALKWGRISRAGLKAGPKMVKGGAKLGIVGGAEVLRDD